MHTAMQHNVCTYKKFIVLHCCRLQLAVILCVKKLLTVISSIFIKYRKRHYNVGDTMKIKIVQYRKHYKILTIIDVNGAK